jgi:hypothetical protein
LPVILLGLVCIFHTSMTHKPSIDLFPPKPPIDFDKCFGGVPKDTIVVLEDGGHDKGLIGSDQLKNRTLNINFTKNSKPIGAMKVNFFSENNMLKIQSIVNAECQFWQVILEIILLESSASG